jgi:hypothetical protein
MAGHDGDVVRGREQQQHNARGSSAEERRGK